MGWVNEAIVELNAGRSIQIQASGGSMRGRIESGQLVTLEPVDRSQLKAEDIVLVRLKQDYLLHLIREADGERLVIGNTLGKINGTAVRSDVLGIVTRIEDQPLATAKILGRLKTRLKLLYRVKLVNDQDVFAVLQRRIAKSLGELTPGQWVTLGGVWNQRYQILAIAEPPAISPVT